LPAAATRGILSRVSALAPVLVLPEEVTHERLAEIARRAEEVVGRDGTQVVVDLAEVRFLGSGGLGELVKLGKRLRDRGGGIALARPRPAIRRLLALVGLDGVLRVFPTLEEAQGCLERERPVGRV
jgi:anti-anti-sigma factor